MLRSVLRGLVTVAGVGLLAGAWLVVFPLIWPADPDASLSLENGRLMGESIGYVWQADAETETILVSPSLVGLRAVPVAVNADTAILIRDKRGGFGDLYARMPVRLIYEVRDEVRIARFIELRAGAATSPAPATEVATAVDSAPGGHWVEAGVFPDADAADRLVARLLQMGLPVSLDPVVTPAGQPPALRVSIGPFADEATATAALQNLQALNYRAASAGSVSQ